MATPSEINSSHLGSAACVIIGPQEYTQIYYQAADGSIHVRKGKGPVVHDANYSDRMLIPPGIARFNTPLAVIFWAGVRNGNFGEIRLYYISNDNFVRELESNDFSDSWEKGLFDQKNFKAAPNTGLLYACIPLESRNPGNPRVGFQSANDPGRITEAVWIDNGWTSALL